MPGRAKSKTKQAQIAREERERVMEVAVAEYRAELVKPEESRKGLRTICKDVADEHLKKTGKKVRLDHNTLLRRVNGGKSRGESNAEKSWLTPEETETVIKFAEELADRGIPLTHKTLEEHVNFILTSRLGKTGFRGVGKNWTDRFLEKHSDRLKTFFASPLDRSRANAANPTTHKMFFDLLEKTVKEYNIEEDCIYAADETGFMPGRACRSRVIGKANAKGQHRKEGGNRQIITVMPTICADGTTIPPLVIFAGRAYQVSWEQNNPLNASIGYQKKGYMDGELGIDWIKNFDKHTKAKTGDRHRGLLVDCHRSRLTLEFLLYCQKRNIHVICYPSHSTHLYQGLDVVIFAILKQAFSKEMLDFEARTGQVVTKDNFLSVYAPAHLTAFTDSNIRAAFAKTGIFPFSREAISVDAMKTSIESSCTGDGLPLPQPSPVRAVAQMFSKNATRANSQSKTNPFARSDQQSVPIDPVLLLEDAQNANQQLARSSAGFLVSSSPVKASSKVPIHIPSYLPPLPVPTELLSLIPNNINEERLLLALQQYVRREARYFSALTGLQASMVLQSLYCERLRGQLFAKELKDSAPKATGKLASDGLPRCLTADEFVEQVRAYAQRQVAEVVEKDRKKLAREAYANAVKEWARLEGERKAAKQRRKEEWADEVAEWERERVCAKLEKRKPRWKKPVLGKFPKAMPKPKMPKGATEVESVEEEFEEFDLDANTTTSHD